MHIRDKELLQQIYKFFNVGTLRETNNVIYYSVRSIKDLDVVVSHFTEFPLQTQKGADFILFAKAFHMIKNKSHLTTSGIEDIVSLKASMRCARGINNTLMCYFPNTVPVERSIIFSGAGAPSRMNFRFCCLRRARTRGCFTTVLRKSNSQVRLRFNITQHVRDIDLMNKICEYFQCGTVYINRKTASYNVYSNKMNTIIIAKFFIQYPGAADRQILKNFLGPGLNINNLKNG